MLKSRLCDYSDPFILFKGTVTVANAAAANNINKNVILENYALFINGISKVSKI